MEQPCNFQQCVHIRMNECQRTSGLYAGCRYRKQANRIEALEVETVRARKAVPDDFLIAGAKSTKKLRDRITALEAVVEKAKECSWFCAGRVARGEDCGLEAPTGVCGLRDVAIAELDKEDE